MNKDFLKGIGLMALVAFAVFLAFEVAPARMERSGLGSSLTEVSTSTSVALTTGTSTVLAYGECSELRISNCGGADAYISGLPTITSSTGIQIVSSTGVVEWGVSGGKPYCGPLYGTADAATTLCIYRMR